MTLAREDSRIDTPRLILRRIQAADLPFYARIHADPDVARYLGHGRPRSDEETQQWLQVLLHTYEAFGLGQLAVVRRDDQALIGRCGLGYFEIEQPPLPGPYARAWFAPGVAPPEASVRVERELGYTLDRHAWGHGYASEAAGAVARYARERLALARIISIIHPQNAASLGVARKFKLEREASVVMAERTYDLYRWPA